MNKVVLNPKDRLLLFGYGLFETLRVNPQGIEVPHLHWERMASGGEILGLDVPDFPHWLQSIKEFLASEHVHDGSSHSSHSSFALRVTLSGGVPSPHHPLNSNVNVMNGNVLGLNRSRLLFNTRPLIYTSDYYDQGVELVVLPSPRNEHSILVRLKSTNYLENVLAREQAQRQGAFDGLWLNTKGQLVESTLSNLFFVTKGILYTPSVTCGCLPGTRRSLILTLASSLEIPFIEGVYELDDLFNAEEVFLTNALMGIMPVRKIDDHQFRIPWGYSDSVTLQLSRAYQTMLNQ